MKLHWFQGKDIGNRVQKIAIPLEEDIIASGLIEVDIEWANTVVVYLQNIGRTVGDFEFGCLCYTSENGISLFFWRQHIHIIVAIYEVAFANNTEECTVERYEVEVLEPEEDALVQERQFCGMFFVTGHLYLWVRRRRFSQ